MRETSPQTAAPPPVPPEHRREPRFRIEAEVNVETQTNFYGGFTFDISTGGLFVTMFDAMPEVGEEVALRFTVPGGAPIHVRARVAWRRDTHTSSADALPGVGLQFLELPQAARECVERFVNAREPIFFVG